MRVLRVSLFAYLLFGQMFSACSFAQITVTECELTECKGFDPSGPVLEYFCSKPIPVFSEHDTQPRLTHRHGKIGTYCEQKYMADYWGYALHVVRPDPSGDFSQRLAPGAVDREICSLAVFHPDLYALQMQIAPQFQQTKNVPCLPPETWCRDECFAPLLNAGGKKVWSPSAPDLSLQLLAEWNAVKIDEIKDTLNAIIDRYNGSPDVTQQIGSLDRLPVSILTNDGEYGLGALGWDGENSDDDINYWMQDKGAESGFNSYWELHGNQAEFDKIPESCVHKDVSRWFDYVSRESARQQMIVRDIIKREIATEAIYLQYNTHMGNTRLGESERFWRDEHDHRLMAPVSDMPNIIKYVRGSHFTAEADPLSYFLSVVGQLSESGECLSYNWVNGGYFLPELFVDTVAKYKEEAVACVIQARTSAEAAGIDRFDRAAWTAYADQMCDESLTKSRLTKENLTLKNLIDFDYSSDPERYTGFLKCLYTAGMIGGQAGYFGYTHEELWFWQLESLSRVHALFSHLHTFVLESSLLGGPNKHRWSGPEKRGCYPHTTWDMPQDYPAYEFPAQGPAYIDTIGGHRTDVYPHTRVLVRMSHDGEKYLITLWAADGIKRAVKIKGLTQYADYEFEARPCGSVYIGVAGGEPKLLDVTGMLPTQSLDLDEEGHLVR